MVRCPSCSSELESAGRFCPECGSSLESATPLRAQAGDADASEAATSLPTEGPTAARKSASVPSSSDPGLGRFAPGTMLNERYRIVALVGRGGMGEVYRADDLRLGQPVALKG